MSEQWATVYHHKGFEIEIIKIAKMQGEKGYRIKGYETLSLFDTVQDAIGYIDAGKVYII